MVRPLVSRFGQRRVGCAGGGGTPLDLLAEMPSAEVVTAVLEQLDKVARHTHWPRGRSRLAPLCCPPPRSTACLLLPPVAHCSGPVAVVPFCLLSPPTSTAALGLGGPSKHQTWSNVSLPPPLRRSLAAAAHTAPPPPSHLPFVGWPAGGCGGRPAGQRGGQ